MRGVCGVLIGACAGEPRGCSVIASRRVPVNEGCLPAGVNPLQLSSGSSSHKVWVTEQVIKVLNAMSQHFSFRLITSECPPPTLHASLVSQTSMFSRRLNPFLPAITDLSPI